MNTKIGPPTPVQKVGSRKDGYHAQSKSERRVTDFCETRNSRLREYLPLGVVMLIRALAAIPAASQDLIVFGPESRSGATEQKRRSPNE